LIDCRTCLWNFEPSFEETPQGVDPGSQEVESVSEVGPVLFLKIKVIARLPFATNKPQQMPRHAAIRS
jgi:hypothetical protein